MTMTWTVRPFNPSLAEYEAALSLRNQLFPENPSTVQIWQHGDASRPSDSKFERWVAVAENGRLLAYAHLDETKPGSSKFEFNFQILPVYWQSPLPEAIYNKILERIENHHSETIVINVLESETAKLRLLKAQNFQQVMRYPLSHLDVANFDPVPFTPLLEKVTASGIRLGQPPINWQDDPHWQHLIHDLDWALLQDVPHHEERVQTPFGQFVQEEFNHPNFLLDGYFIAFDGDEPVGMTNFVKQGGETDRLATSITGVLRRYRRQGIATALKVQSIRYAQKLGAKTIIVSNEENNPMYWLNMKLGFRPQPAWTDWEKRLVT